MTLPRYPTATKSHAAACSLVPSLYTAFVEAGVVLCCGAGGRECLSLNEKSSLTSDNDRECQSMRLVVFVEYYAHTYYSKNTHKNVLSYIHALPVATV